MQNPCMVADRISSRRTQRAVSCSHLTPNVRPITCANPPVPVNFHLLPSLIWHVAPYHITSLSTLGISTVFGIYTHK